MTIRRIEAGPRMSQAVIHGNTVYLAGQVGARRERAEQTKPILATIDRLLQAAGSDKSKILQAIIWLADMKDFAEMNAVWDNWVDAGTRRPAPPARPSSRRRNTRSRSSSPRRSEDGPGTVAISGSNSRRSSLRSGKRNCPGIPASLRRETCHQRVAVAGIGERDMGHRLVGAPGSPLDHEAWAAPATSSAAAISAHPPPSRGCVCSAALHGTRPSSHGPGAISAKLSSAASGTAARLISRSSRQNGLLRRRNGGRSARPTAAGGNLERPSRLAVTSVRVDPLRRSARIDKAGRAPAPPP